VWSSLHEALGMRSVGYREHALPLLAHRGRHSVMHDGRRQEAEPAVAVLMVVPTEEVLPEGPAILQRSEPLGKVGTVFERFELGFRKRIVVRDVRTTMRFGHGQVGEQQRDGFAPHRRAAVGVQRELARLNAVLRTGLGDEAFSERRALVRRQHPADDVPAEDVEDHVEIEVRPFRRAQQLGDIPAPDFVGTRSQELGCRVVRAPDLIAPLLDLVGGVQNAVHRARRAEIPTLIEQRGVDLRGRLVDEARVEEI